MKIRSKICEIQFLSMLCQELGFDCFTRYHANVNSFEISLNFGKWSRDSKKADTEFYIDDSGACLEKADAIIYQLKSILKKGNIDYSELLKWKESK